jgi:hypothetical protein
MARRDRVKKSTGKKKVSFHLGAEALERLGLHALKSGQRPAAMVEGLILTHLRRYRISDLGSQEGQAQEDRVD